MVRTFAKVKLYEIFDERYLWTLTNHGDLPAMAKTVISSWRCTWRKHTFRAASDSEV
jgi:hypothetical protein